MVNIFIRALLVAPALTLATFEWAIRVVTGSLRRAFIAYLVCGATMASASSLDGQSGTFALYYPNTSSLLAGPLAFEIGGAQVVIPNVGNGDWLLQGSGLTLTFGFDDQGCCTTPADFGGAVVTFTDMTFPGLASVSLDSTNIFGFDSSRISFTANSISINIQGGLDLQNNRQVTLTLAPVPEPETYALLLAGLVLMLGIAKGRAVAR